MCPRKYFTLTLIINEIISIDYVISELRKGILQIPFGSYGGELQNRVLVNLCDSTYSSASWDVVSARGTAMASLKLVVRVSQYRQY